MRSPRRRVTVIGAGYVGTVTAVGLAGLGHDVELVETDPNRLVALQDGRLAIHEPGLLEGLARAIDRGCSVSRPPRDRTPRPTSCASRRRSTAPANPT